MTSTSREAIALALSAAHRASLALDDSTEPTVYVDRAALWRAVRPTAPVGRSDFYAALAYLEARDSEAVTVKARGARRLAVLFANTEGPDAYVWELLFRVGDLVPLLATAASLGIDVSTPLPASALLPIPAVVLDDEDDDEADDFSRAVLAAHRGPESLAMTGARLAEKGKAERAAFLASTADRLPESKRCPKCAETLPREKFGRRSNGGIQSWCIACTRAAVYANPKRLKERGKAAPKRPTLTASDIVPDQLSPAELAERAAAEAAKAAELAAKRAANAAHIAALDEEARLRREALDADHKAAERAIDSADRDLRKAIRTAPALDKAALFALLSEDVPACRVELGRALLMGERYRHDVAPIPAP